MTKVVSELENRLSEGILSENENIYSVPENWVWIKLGNNYAICLDKFRKPVNARERAERGGGIPYYGATGQVGWIDNYLTDEELVIVGEDGAPFLDPYKKKAYMIKGKAWVNNHAHILKSNFGSIGNKYLLFYLNQFDFTNYVNGTTRLKLTQKQMNNIPIPLPPAMELNRIVGKLEYLLGKIDEAKRLTKEAQTSFELRRAAILNKAFRGEITEKWRNENLDIKDSNFLYDQILNSRNTKAKNTRLVNQDDIRFNIPEKWKWVRIGEVMSITSGGTPKRSSKEYYEGDIPWIKTGEIKWNYLEDSEEKITLEAINNSSAKLLPKGSVLIAMYGQGLTRGRASILNIDATCNQAVCALLPNEYILPEFLFYYFMEGYNRFRKLAQGGNQENFSASLISTFLMPLPPLEEQREIVRILKKLIEKENEALKFISQKENIEILKKTILSKAFRGELGTNDPTEESAIELLKEVLQEKLK